MISHINETIHSANKIHSLLITEQNTYQTSPEEKLAPLHTELSNFEYRQKYGNISFHILQTTIFFAAPTPLPAFFRWHYYYELDNLWDLVSFISQVTT